MQPLPMRMFVSSALVAAFLLLGSGCKSNRGTAGKASNPVTLNGAGSTFVYPVLSRWSSEFEKVEPNVHVNYQSIGSGGGVRQLISHTVHFGATDAPMTDDQLKEAERPVLHIPLVMGAVVPTYNLPDLKQPIRFTPEVLAGIFLGEIKTWDDPKIASANHDLKLAHTPIIVVHRSDDSGTTNIWTDYLSKVSPAWKDRVGASTAVHWPIGLAGRGNEGVAGMVRQTPGAIGYVELTYAVQNKMPAGVIRNRAGRFVEPTVEAVTAAAAGELPSIPDDLRYSITDSPADRAWPASGTTWAVIYADMPAGGDRKALVDFLRWVLHEGQTFCASLDYAGLPDALIQRADQKLSHIETALTM